jgi:glutathione synthase/RimK-type ligase-like ATP-grasp enzyme
MSTWRVALLTERRYVGSVAPEGDAYLANILADDALLGAALAKHAIASVRIDWADPTVDWSGFDAALFRTTWDYFDRFPEFSDWLARVETQTRLLNPTDLLWWNIDKHYLADLEKRGVPIVPSRFLEKGSTVPLKTLLQECGWDEAVLKPCVSGGARHTYRLNRETATGREALAQELLQTEALMLQPFVPEIMTAGEDSLMVIGGRYTHAVRKIARSGDFRVQDDHGGTVHPLTPDVEQIAFAERAVAACSPAPLYARVDTVRDSHGTLALMELELVEPELWLRCHPPAAEALADAVAEKLR